MILANLRRKLMLGRILPIFLMLLAIGTSAMSNAFAQKKPAPPRSPLSVLCVGDSITAAPWGRRRLKADLDKAGYRTDFVGTQFGANPEGGFTDGEHEGYPGYKIADVMAKIIAPGEGVLARFSPDIVLVLVGTNDIGQGQLAGAADHLMLLLRRIRKDEPKAHIFVGTIPALLPNAFSGYNTHAADVGVYNAAAVGVVSRLRARDKRFHLVDLNAALPATNDYLGDGVHPTGYGVADEKDGYARLGDAWFRAIQSVYAAPVSTRR